MVDWNFARPDKFEKCKNYDGMGGCSIDKLDWGICETGYRFCADHVRK